MRGPAGVGTIRAAAVLTVSPNGHLVVALTRRFAVLLIALFASLSIAGTALASAQDVINDFLDNGTIDTCHSQADYDAARGEKVESLYGDFPGAIDAALDNPALVGTADAPCPATAGTAQDSGIGTTALILIPMAAILLGAAVVLARRRRSGTPDGSDQSG